MLPKRDIVAQMSSATGVTRILERGRIRTSLFVLNYHRVGDAARTIYDSGTFSCSAAEFDWQVGWLRQYFAIIPLDKAIEVIHGRSSLARNSVLLTFDDGYHDNYDIAFPILRKHGVSGTFFLPTLFVGSDVLPWWDQIARLVKTSTKQKIVLSYPTRMEFNLTEQLRPQAIRDLLNIFKSEKTEDSERFICELAESCSSTRVAQLKEPCFVTWQEVRQMTRAGMFVGSHTHSHKILSKLTYAEQLAELTTSKSILERELDTPIDVLAYPVGRKDSFSDETLKAAAAADYHTAFSFYSGVNSPGDIDFLDVKRIGVNQDRRTSFRFRLACLAATGREF